MSHDLESSWAATEIAFLFRTNPELCFRDPPKAETLSIYASRENSKDWPVADGIIQIEHGTNRTSYLALEYKRINEGVHGILTALGQAYAYLEKGCFSGSVLALPKSYQSLSDPCERIKRIIDKNSPNLPIGVFAYGPPDTTATSPFKDKISCIKYVNLENSGHSPSASSNSKVQTLWGHFREGSSDPDTFFKYLLTGKRFIMDDHVSIPIQFPPPLVQACHQIVVGCDVEKYLSNSTLDTQFDKIWRNFWFKYVFHPEMMEIWKKDPKLGYVVNDQPLKLRDPNGKSKKFFAGRKDSIKNQLVADLNDQNITEEQAWHKYIKKVRDRAHSFREDVDSGLAALGMLEPDGKPSELGYRYIDACERSGNPNTGVARSILGSALLKNAGFSTLLHYVHHISEDLFSLDPLAFSEQRKKKFVFKSKLYREKLANVMSQELCIMRTVSKRADGSRYPFQAEFHILKILGFAKNSRLGVGLAINWPAVQEAMEYPI